MQAQKTVAIPKTLFYSILHAQKKWEAMSEELEDFLMTHNPEFLKKMNRAKKEHRSRDIVTLEELKRMVG